MCMVGDCTLLHSPQVFHRVWKPSLLLLKVFMLRVLLFFLKQEFGCEDNELGCLRSEATLVTKVSAGGFLVKS